MKTTGRAPLPGLWNKEKTVELLEVENYRTGAADLKVTFEEKSLPGSEAPK